MAQTPANGIVHLYGCHPQPLIVGREMVFIGNSDKDPHVPVSRSEESKRIMEKLGAAVTLKIYPSMPHTVIEDEINWVNENILE